MDKQHQNAVQKAKDLEELKRQEIEYQKYQQMLTNQKDRFNQMKKSLELTATARSEASKKSQKELANSIKESLGSLKSSKSSKSTIKSKQQDTISEMSTSTNNTTNTTQSSVSQISINKNLANKLKSKNTKSKEREITIDQISFGSNKNKK
jgi:hypothetical protein